MHKQVKSSLWLLAYQVMLRASLLFFIEHRAHCCLHEYLINLLICNMYSHNSFVYTRSFAKNAFYARQFLRSSEFESALAIDLCEPIFEIEMEKRAKVNRTAAKHFDKQKNFIPMHIETFLVAQKYFIEIQ